MKRIKTESGSIYFLKRDGEQEWFSGENIPNDLSQRMTAGVWYKIVSRGEPRVGEEFRVMYLMPDRIRAKTTSRVVELEEVGG